MTFDIDDDKVIDWTNYHEPCMINACVIDDDQKYDMKEEENYSDEDFRGNAIEICIVGYDGRYVQSSADGDVRVSKHYHLIYCELVITNCHS